MAKAKAHPDQLGFDLDVPLPASQPGALAGLRRAFSELVGIILASEPRSRTVVAAEMTDLLDRPADRPVTKAMLDAYSSGAREDHGIPADVLWALLAVTGRIDLLDPHMRKIGGSIVVGREVETVRIGQLRRQQRAINAELARLEKSAPPIRGEH